MNKSTWDTSTDPPSMIRHLESKGCSFEFDLLENEVLDRIRPAISEPAFVRILDCLQGRVDYSIDEANADARDRIARLSTEVAELSFTDPAYQSKTRQIQIGNALCVFEGQGFSETMIALCEELAEIADAPTEEREWQAETIRRFYAFDFVPTEDDSNLNW